MATQRDVMERIQALTRQANQVSAAIAESDRANTASMEAIRALPENIRQRITDASTQNLAAVSGALDTLATSLNAVGEQSGQGQAGAEALQDVGRTERVGRQRRPPRGSVSF